MKKKTKILLIVLAIILVLAAAAAVIVLRMNRGSRTPIDNNPEPTVSGNSNVLVAYFSWSGHGQQMANWVAEETGGELFRIVPEVPYGDDFDTVADRAQTELNDGTRPALSAHIDPEIMAKFNTVYLGFPIWWYDLPTPVWSFLEEYDLSGKTMSKKVLILSGSPRKGGNSDLLCGEFARGAQENGNEVEIIRVAAKKIAPCSGCYYCRAHNGECTHKDGMAEVLQKMIDADVIVMASPVYFYSIDAQLKAVIDRTVARWLEVKNKDFYYVVTMADEDVSSADATLACLRGYAACVRGAQEKGVIIGSCVYEPGKVKDTSAMQQAYQMGKNV